MVRRLTKIRRKLRAGEKDFGKVFRNEAREVREAINTPRAQRRLGEVAKKPLLDAPQQLRGKRIRPSLRFFGPLAVEIKIRRKKKR